MSEQAGSASHCAMPEAMLNRARAAVVTLDSAKAAVASVEAIRHEAPQLPVFARARDHAHAVGLAEAGNLQAVPEMEASLQLAARLLRARRRRRDRREAGRPAPRRRLCGAGETGRQRGTAARGAVRPGGRGRAAFQARETLMLLATVAATVLAGICLLG